MHTVRSRSHPAVRNIYKYAKGQAKLGLKEMKNRLKHKDLERGVQRGGSLRCEGGAGGMQRRIQSDCLQSRLPITQHFGQSRPRRPARRYTNVEGFQRPPPLRYTTLSFLSVKPPPHILSSHPPPPHPLSP
uniref:Uncharacterized protein n=1 Tax=Callorhinchus milii TaxID=7868 RepID=A0A4W3GZ56_CALMI